MRQFQCVSSRILALSSSTYFFPTAIVLNFNPNQGVFLTYMLPRLKIDVEFALDRAQLEYAFCGLSRALAAWLRFNADFRGFFSDKVRRCPTWMCSVRFNAISVAGYLSSTITYLTWIQMNNNKEKKNNKIISIYYKVRGFYLQLREIGLQYYDCSGNPQIENVVGRLRESRLKAPVRAFEQRERCASMLDEGRVHRSVFTGKRWVYCY